MKKQTGFLAQDLRRAFDALAYAHLGEMLAETTKRDLVSNDSQDPVPGFNPAGITASIPMERRKRVALVVDQRVRSGALRYALSACDRLNADLEVLTNLPATEIEQALAHEDIEPGLTCQVFRLGKDRLAGIAKHVRCHVNTLFVVTSATDALADKLVMERPEGLDAHVPWLVVSDELCAA